MPATMATLEKALKLHRAGGLCEARRLYWHILEREPRNADALHLLGVASHQLGQLEEALAFLQKAVALDPGRAEYHNALGEVLGALDRVPESQASFEEALRLRSDFAEAHNNLGLLYKFRGDTNPALRCFYRAMQLRPDFAEPYHHVGVLAVMLRQSEQALECFQKAVQLDPNYAAAYSNWGIAYLSLKRYAEAADCFREAIRLAPRYAPAHNNLGIVLQVQGQLDAALSCFEEAVRLGPPSAEYFNNQGNVLRLHERFAEALHCYQQALRLNPEYAEARANLGMLLKEEGRHTEAVAGFEQAHAQAPSDALKLLSLLTLPIIPESLDDLLRQRKRFEGNLARLSAENPHIDDPARQVSNLAFYLAYQGMNDRPIMAELAALFARATPSLRYTAPHCLAPDAAEGRRLRVGFVSRGFYNHSVGRLFLGFIRLLARERFHVTVFNFRVHDDDVWRSIRDAADAMILLPFHLEEARQKIADEQLDVLFYADIGMDPWTYFLCFSRLAPVQCTTWGHPVTTGVPTMDYYLSARDLELPDAAEHYTEHLVQFENLPTFYYRLPPLRQARTRKDFGLDEEAHLYVCPQSLFKLHPEFDILLDRILDADPHGRIVLVAGHSDYWTTLLLNRLRGVLGERSERVVVLPRQSSEDFRALLGLADVVLDPIHFGSGNTAYETFEAGSPLVTLRGQFMRGRIVYACYQRMGILDCVAADAEDYVRRAVRIANDPALRADLRTRILAAKDGLFENVGIIRELEQFFLTALRQASESQGMRIFEQGSSKPLDNTERALAPPHGPTRPALSSTELVNG